MLGAMRKSERKTRELRCAKPSAPKPSRRRMKPILHWRKSKVEAWTFVHIPAVEKASKQGRPSFKNAEPLREKQFEFLAAKMSENLTPPAFSEPGEVRELACLITALLIRRYAAICLRNTTAALAALQSVTLPLASAPARPTRFRRPQCIELRFLFVG